MGERKKAQYGSLRLLLKVEGVEKHGCFSLITVPHLFTGYLLYCSFIDVNRDELP